MKAVEKRKAPAEPGQYPEELHSLQIEMSVLGSCMWKEQAVQWTIKNLPEEAFVLPSHRVVYRAIIKLGSASRPVDVVSLRATLSAAGDLQEAGGENYLLELARFVPSAAHFQYYGEKLHDLWQKRRGYDEQRKLDYIVLNGASAADLKLAFRLASDEIGVMRTAESSWVRGDEVEFEEIRYLSNPFFGRGSLSVVAGDSGAGKSTFLRAVMSCFTNGRGVGGAEQIEPVSVMYLSMEDNVERKVVPAMKALGARIERMHFYKLPKDSAPLVIDSHGVAEIAAAVREHGIGALFIDTLMDFFPPGVNINSTSEVYGALKPLRTVAEDTDIHIGYTMHLNKSSISQNPIHRIGNSTAFGAFPRTIIMIGQDPEEGSTARIATLAKDQLEGLSQGHGYRMIYQDGAFRWDGLTSVTATEMFSQEDPSHRSHKRSAAEQWLRELLAEEPMAQKMIERAAEEGGQKIDTVRSAKKAIGCISRKVGAGAQGIWFWALTDEQFDDWKRKNNPTREEYDPYSDTLGV